MDIFLDTEFTRFDHHPLDLTIALLVALIGAQNT
jgi:hypothetical protein